MENIIKTLMAAKYLIADPKNWTTKTMARDFDGNRVLAISGNAVSFCAVGAIEKVGILETSTADSIKALHKTADRMGWLSADVLNDSPFAGGHSKVMEMFDKAIDECMKKVKTV